MEKESYISLGGIMFYLLSLRKNTPVESCWFETIYFQQRNKALKSVNYTWGLRKCFPKLIYSNVRKGHNGIPE